MPDHQTDHPATQEHAVYLAGPGVFRQNARAHGAHLVAACTHAGLKGLYPLDAELDAQAYPTPPAFAAAIAQANMGLIRRCQGVIADLSPFRGPNVDDGTAFEIGYAHALGLPVFGYVEAGSHTALYPDRVRASGAAVTSVMADNHAILVDEDGLVVEDFGLPVNLMIATVLSASGTIFPSAEGAIAAAAAHLRSQSGA